MRTWSRFVFALAIVLVLSAPSVYAIRILCTTTIVGDIVGRIAGDAASVAVLLPVGTDPHAFQPSPQDAITVDAADIVFRNGAGLETSLLPLLQGARGRVVDLSSGLELRAHDEHHENEDSDGHEHEGADPHVWFDPRNVIEWGRVIERTLTEVDPEHAAEYAARSASYGEELARLDAWIQERVLTIPSEARRIVSDHEAFGYFAARYGFVQVGTVIPGYSTLSEPSARELAALEDAIRAADVRCLFVGTTLPPALAEQVAADTGSRIVFLYTGSLSEADGPAASYVDLMRFDVDQIVAGLAESW